MLLSLSNMQIKMGRPALMRLAFPKEQYWPEPPNSDALLIICPADQ